jgi:L-alanine-DL-glutamate epimerase-like enolase superfamily enzyme
MLKLTVTPTSFKTDGVFRISRGSRTESKVVHVTIDDGNFRGQGECVPYPRYGESSEGVVADIMAMSDLLNKGLTREELQLALPAGAARNALDCAFWDLEAKRSGKRVWELLGLPAPEGVVTAFTLSLDEPDIMREKARQNANRPLLKLKLAGPEDLLRVQAVREGAPDADLMVDANEGWDVNSFAAIVPELQKLGVVAIEQPLPAADDAALGDIDHPIPLIADESCHASDSYDDFKDRYDIINIKLDKTGGLTEALKLKKRAEDDGKKVMVGCMVGSSLAMAPAMIIAQSAAIVDLDGPLLLAEDRPTPIIYTGSVMSLPPRDLWG